MNRIYFHSTAQTLHRQVQPAPYTNGTPCPAVSSIDELRPSFSLTGNKGNMVHAEAALKLLDANRSRTSVGNLAHVRKAYGASFTRYMNDNFDCVVLSLANFIRKGMDHTTLVSVLNEIQIPIIVFGAGMQAPVADPAMLHVSTRSLIALLDEKCTLMGVRGDKTSDFLLSLGYRNHKILGCPSMYVYPRNILAIQPVQFEAGNRWATAGHISYNNLNGSRPKFKRSYALLECIESESPDYVFQDEVFSFTDLLNIPGLYNDATGKMDRDLINGFFQAKLGIPMPFANYWWFNEVSQWRQHMLSMKFYLGDRFHGGVVAMQGSVPAVFIATDQRIDELTEFFGIPKTSFNELRSEGLHAVVNDRCSAESLDTFKARYRTRLHPFVEAVTGAGLQLVNRQALLQAGNSY